MKEHLVPGKAKLSGVVVSELENTKTAFISICSKVCSNHGLITSLQPESNMGYCGGVGKNIIMLQLSCNLWHGHSADKAFLLSHSRQSLFGC